MKSFLKPTKTKTILFLLLSLLAFTIGQSKHEVGSVSRGGVAPWCYEWIDAKTSLWPLTYVIPLCISDLHGLTDWNYITHKLKYRSIQFLNPLWPFVLVFITSIMYWYFLSCLFIFIYDHRKKQRRT